MDLCCEGVDSENMVLIMMAVAQYEALIALPHPALHTALLSNQTLGYHVPSQGGILSSSCRVLVSCIVANNRRN